MSLPVSMLPPVTRQTALPRSSKGSRTAAATDNAPAPSTISVVRYMRGFIAFLTAFSDTSITSSTTPYIVRKALAPKHYHTRVAQTTEEEVKLCNQGYEYVKDTKNGGSLWRKRKRYVAAKSVGGGIITRIPKK